MRVEMIERAVEQPVLDIVHAVGVDARVRRVQKFHACRIERLMRVLEHFVARDGRRRTQQLEVLVHDASVHVVVFAAPAPVVRRVAVDETIVFAAHRENATDQLRVRQIELKLVDGHAQVTWEAWARVHVSIVHGEQIDIVHDEARRVGLQTKDLFETAVHDDALVERFFPRLFAHVDPVVELLPLENVVRVVEKVLQDFQTISVRDDDGDFVPWSAFRWSKGSTQLYANVRR